MDLLRAMQVFERVAKTESFSAASRELSLSVSAVSRLVKELEDWSDLQLLNRTTRRVSLTHEGLRYLEQMRDIVHQVERLESDMGNDRKAPAGRLRLTAPVFISHHFLTPILPAFLARYPEIDLELDVLDRRVDLIDEGYDLAIRVGVLDDSRLQARKLARFGLSLVASPDYLKRAGRPERVDDLQQHQCLIDTVPRYLDRWPLRGARLPVPNRVRINNGDMIRELAIQGAGIAFLPDWMVDQAVHQGLLERLLPGANEMDGGIYALYPQRRHQSRNIRTFVDFLLEHKQGLG